jgi:hypothetical protein
MSLAMRLLAPNLEELVAYDDGKVRSVAARVIGSDQGHGGSNLDHLGFFSAIGSSG